jgi:hypothetical protein
MKLRARLHLAAALVLAFGLTFSFLVYFTAEEATSGEMDEMVMSKQYTGTIQRFGGRQAVLFDEFSRWFTSLWQGKRLGVTIACLGVATAGALYLIARRMDNDK